MEAELVRELKKLAYVTAQGQFGRGDNFDAAAFWDDFDEMQIAMETFVPDPNAT